MKRDIEEGYIDVGEETYCEKYCNKCSETIIEELKSLRRVSAKLDAVIESSYDGIYITDGEARTLRINKAYEQISGIERETLLGKSMYELVNEGYISQSGTIAVLEKKKTITIQQTLSNHKTVLITSTPVLDDQENIDMVVTNVRDITQLIKLQEELEEKKRRIKQYHEELSEMKKIFDTDDEMVSKDHKTRALLVKSRRVALHDTTVLITGETGTGKELMAKFIHKNSKRKRKNFVKVNCAAIPENLIESELFGYEKGAFTGANNSGKSGLFEMANKGTIFLDEIGELPLSMQAKILRVIQEQEIQRLGSTKVTKIDVRIIAATNRDLEKMVHEDKFREDLYYRLNIVPIKLYPLRERREDILPLAEKFLEDFNEKYGADKKFSKDVLNTVYSYDWPGNVRELKNIVERAFVMGAEEYVTAEELPDHMTKGGSYITIEEELWDIKKASSVVEAKLIKKAFDKCHNVREAAKLLGIDASTFVRKRKKYEEQGYI